MRRVEGKFAPKRRRQRVAVIGGGNVGFMVAEQLQEYGADLTVIESDFERSEKLAALLPKVLVLRGDGTDLELLEQERIEDADVVVAVTSDDATNLLVSLLAKQLGIPKVITRVGRPATGGCSSASASRRRSRREPPRCRRSSTGCGSTRSTTSPASRTAPRSWR
jgi:trk system potassium uptake protein